MKYLKLSKVVCPHCGYKMPIFYNENTISKNIYVRCKGKKCKKIFEIKINEIEIK